MARYKRETLEDKNVRDLRQLVVKLGIVGQTKKPKAVIIDAIMAKYGVTAPAGATISKDGPAVVAPLSGIEAKFQSSVTKPGLKKRDRLSTTIQVSCGASSGSFPVAGHSVAEVGVFRGGSSRFIAACDMDSLSRAKGSISTLILRSIMNPASSI